MTGTRAPLRPWLLPAALLALVAAVAGGLLLGRGGPQVAAVDDAVSVGFARDMSVHHAQAVRMSEVVHRRSADPELNYLALDILTTQHGQIGIMSGWLTLSGQTTRGSGPAMAWTGEPHDGPMPGMATEQEVRALDALPVAQMEQEYLRLMIRHHRGGVPMAAYAAEHAGHEAVVRLAGQMRDGQEYEVDLMQQLLADRGWAPEPEGEHAGH